MLTTRSLRSVRPWSRQSVWRKDGAIVRGVSHPPGALILGNPLRATISFCINLLSFYYCFRLLFIFIEGFLEDEKRSHLKTPFPHSTIQLTHPAVQQRVNVIDRHHSPPTGPCFATGPAYRYRNYCWRGNYEYCISRRKHCQTAELVMLVYNWVPNKERRKATYIWGKQHFQNYVFTILHTLLILMLNPCR
jgi:hypothetical protein